MNDRDTGVPGGALEALHDISNALTVILGWMEEGSRPGASESLRSRALQIAAKKAREARTLARQAIGAADDRSAPTPASAIVRDVVESLAIEMQRGGVRVEVAGEDLDALVAGATTLTHIVTNVLLNALAFSPRGGAIYVRLACAGDNVEISVSDEGPGVDPKIAPRIFQGASLRPGGAGIGLRHAREVVRQLGGDLVHVVESSRSGSRGATFLIRLPRVEDASDSDGGDTGHGRFPSALMRTLLHGARVLVVEDDRAVCALLEAGLGARGMEVTSVHDGSQLGAALAKVGSVEVVLLDLSPIAHDLQGALATVRKAAPNAGIVFISGSAIAMEVELTRELTRTRWVRKPFDLGEVAAAIAELLPAR